MIKINLRKINESDKNEFIKMSREFYSSPAVMHTICEDYHARAFDELMRSNEYLECIIVEADEKTAGYALLCKSYSREAGGINIWVDEIYIREEYRSMGAGNMIFDLIEEKMPAARYRLEVEEDNKGAISLYKRRGYEFLPYLQMYKDIDG